MKGHLHNSFFSFKDVKRNFSLFFFFTAVSIISFGSPAYSQCTGLPSATNPCHDPSGSAYGYHDNPTIKNFTLNGVYNNTSGCSSGSYADYSDPIAYPTLVTTLTSPGGPYSVAVTAATGDYASPYAVNIWIDFNEDGDFNDAGEQVYHRDAAADCAGSIFNPVVCNDVVRGGTLSIPGGVTTGTKKLRVRMSHNNNQNVPCGNIDFGEAEDYRIIITGGSINNTITTGAITGSLFCAGDMVSVPFAVTGNFTSGNIYTVQLSDATGDFSSSTNIGALSGNSSGTIQATIPAAANAGSGYRIRVVSNNPPTTGSDNGTNLTVKTVSAGIIKSIPDTLKTSCSNAFVNTRTVGSSGSLRWQTSVTGTNYGDVPGKTDTFLLAKYSETTFFRVIANSGSCLDTSEVFKLTVKPAPFVSFFLKSKINNTYTFNSDSSVASSFSWDFDDPQSGAQNTSTEKNPTHTFIKIGTPRICLSIKNGAGCSASKCVDFIVDDIETVSRNSRFKVYPDPFSDNLFILADKNDVRIEGIYVSDLLGRIVFAKSFNKMENNPLQINLTTLTKGMYYIKIKTSDTNYFQSVIKQ